jgi:hypothetical protein
MREIVLMMVAQVLGRLHTLDDAVAYCDGVEVRLRRKPWNNMFQGDLVSKELQVELGGSAPAVLQQACDAAMRLTPRQGLTIWSVRVN